MIKLTDRLLAIAGEIEAGESVADIGTDHGYLPLFLWERGISHKVVMADISKGSLKKAEDNCRLLYPDNDFDLRLGSGIEVLKPEETDCVVIAGMGGILIKNILNEDKEKTLSFKKLVLQPRNNTGILRHWLLNNGFHISNEQLVREGKFICEIITALPGERAVIKDLTPERIEYQYPYSLIEFKGPLTQEYLSRRLRTEKRILSGMEKGSDTKSKELRSQQYRIDYLERLIKKL